MFFGILWRGVKSGLQTTRTLALIIVPVYLVITVLGKTPVLGLIGRLFRPLMEFLGLPGEAAVSRMAGVKAWPFVVLRLFAGFFLAAGLNFFWV